jgi:Domain of unknown function (DUF397)
METVSSWRKSSYSGANGGECVEVGASADAVIVRDTTNRSGETLRLPANVWRAFLASMK